ncbi:class I SAM-dependent methyltransferase [Haladaptatus salinisoli]|uniref:class I SAM-dependent methyltransferase n=1 Tax=Haladaptatus salinisoli TaxID=2884876 RepID=UPI001D0B96FD|nr:class I SAM-dependent methyltransferase [Haladaptatus salinisoli]
MDTDEVLRRWAKRSGAYSPDYYAYYGPNEASESVRARLDSLAGSNPTVLELGCSSGRHLSHLRDHGYEDLYGIDINDEALDVMEDAYPDLAARGTFYIDAIENVVADFDDGRFDVVYSVETLQHLHPDNEWVFEELSRITDDLLVTVENEGEEGRRSAEPTVNYVDDDFPLYYRNWNRVFSERGFVEVDSEPVERNTLRAFRPTRE